MVELSDALAHLTALGRALGGAIRFETIANHTADTLTGVFAPEAVSVVLETGQRGRFVTSATRGSPTEMPGSPFFDASQRAHEIVRSADPPRLAAPLIGAGHALGVLVLEGRPGTAWDAGDERVLAAVAAQVTIALQNARLLALLSAGKREWEQMVDAIGAAVCIVDERGTVHRANRTFATLVNTPVTALAGRSWQILLPPTWWDAPMLPRREPLPRQ